jgi:site-specific recombinase XerD
MADQQEDGNFEGFQRWLETKDVSKSTIQRYCQAIRNMLRWLNKPPNSITQEDVDNYKLYIKESYDTNSLVPFGAAINNFMRYLGKEIKMKIPPIKHKNVVPLTIREIENMLATSKVTDPLDYAMIATAYYGGLRRNELRNLRITDIDFERGKVRINQGKGNTHDEVNLHPTAIAAIRAYLVHRVEPKEKEHKNHLFISPYSRTPVKRTYLNDRLKVIAQKAGIVKRCYGHLLRHSLCTHMSDNGATIVEIQRQSRHKDIETLSNYIHPDEAKARETYLRTVAHNNSENMHQKASENASKLDIAEKQYSGMSNEQRRQMALDALLTGRISEETYKILTEQLDNKAVQGKPTYIQ